MTRGIVPGWPPHRLRGLAVLVSLLAVVTILATVPRLGLWHTNLIYQEPWYEGAPPECDPLYRSFIDRQLLWTGLPLIASNVLTLAVLWAVLRRRPDSA